MLPISCVIASTHKQTLTPSRPPPASHTPNMGTLPVVTAHTHAQCQAGDHSDIPNIPWCSSSPQLFWPVFVQLSVRTLLKQALHSLLPCQIAGQIIYGSLTAHYLAVCKSTFKSGKHGMTGYICRAENGFCSVRLFATDNGRQNRNNLFIRVACQIKAKGLTALICKDDWIQMDPCAIILPCTYRSIN